MITANEVEGTVQVMASIRRFAEITGASLSEEIIRTARLVAVSVAYSTQPYGKTPAVKLQAEKGVKRDIRRVFATPSSLFNVIEEKYGEGVAKEFWRAHKANDEAKMRAVMDRESMGMTIIRSPEKSIHQKRRGARGRVSGKRAFHLVTDTQSLDRYIAERQRKVGFAKSGWAAAADACGGHRGIPAWASSRHKGRAPGGAIINRDSIHPKVVLFNHVEYITEVCPPDEISDAVRIAYMRLIKRVQILIKKGYAAARLKSE